MDASLQPLPAFRPDPPPRNARRDAGPRKPFALASKSEGREENQPEPPSDDDLLEDDAPDQDVGRSLDVTA